MLTKAAELDPYLDQAVDVLYNALMKVRMFCVDSRSLSTQLGPYATQAQEMLVQFVEDVCFSSETYDNTPLVPTLC